MSESKPWEKYVTQAFVDRVVEIVRNHTPSTAPPYVAGFASDGKSSVVDDDGTCVFSSAFPEISEGIATALNEATKPAPAPTLLEAAKTFVGLHWAKKRREFLSAPSFRATDLYDTVARNLLLAIDRAEAAAKTPPAPTLPEEVVKFAQVAKDWYSGNAWCEIKYKHGILADREEYFTNTAKGIFAKYGGGAE